MHRPSAAKQNNGQIVDICAGRASHNQTADRRERGIGVVLPQRFAGVCPRGAKRCEAVLIDIAARRVRRAVRSVGAEGKDRGPRQTGEALRRGKRQLLIAPAAPMAGQVYNCLSPGQKGQRTVCTRVGTRNGGQEAARLPRLTAEAVSQKDARIAKLPRLLFGGSAERPDAAGHMGRDVRQLFRRFLRETGPCRV